MSHYIVVMWLIQFFPLKMMMVIHCGNHSNYSAKALVLN